MQIFKITIGNTLIYTLLLLALFSGCKKYEEGPRFSLASKKSRVTNKWIIDKTFFNGIELEPTSQDEEYFIEFTKDNKILEHYKYFFEGQEIKASGEYGTWSFDSKKENVIQSLHNGQVETWRIIRLKQKEFFVDKMTAAGNLIRFELKRVK